jgi:BolA protein
MPVGQIMRHKLETAFKPRRLEVIDCSARHAGHAGARPGGESHFDVVVVSQSFSGMGRVARQRLVYQVLAEELTAGLHALALTTLTPAEDSG